jgi:hypothetical protein
MMSFPVELFRSNGFGHCNPVTPKSQGQQKKSTQLNPGQQARRQVYDIKNQVTNGSKHGHYNVPERAIPVGTTKRDKSK